MRSECISNFIKESNQSDRAKYETIQNILLQNKEYITALVIIISLIIFTLTLVIFNNNALDFAPHAALRLRAALGQIVAGPARQPDLFC